MSQNLAALNLTAAELTKLNGALATIRTTLGTRAVSRSKPAAKTPKTL